MEDCRFTLTAPPPAGLAEQLSRALEKQVELASRAQFPRLWTAIDGLRTIPRGRRAGGALRIGLSVFCLLAGLFLLVPGLMEPQELAVPLAVGLVGVAAGLAGLAGALLRAAPRRDTRFTKAARMLLDNAAAPAADVHFAEQGMVVTPDGAAPRALVPYSRFACVVETADLFLAVYDGQALVLPKAAQTAGTAPDLRALLDGRVPLAAA